MKVILLTDVKAQGKKGEVIDVSDGYARNYLIPKKLAFEADKAALAELKNQEAAKAHRIEVEKQQAKEVAEKLESVQLKIKVTAGADGKLYGSVTTKDIAEKLLEQTGIEIDRRKIEIPEVIKSHGSYLLTVKLYADVTGKINLLVTA